MLFNDWKNSSQDNVLRDFGLSDEERRKWTVVGGSYVYENYDGRAILYVAQDGKLYEVTGSHCSCNGLEGDFTPQEVRPSTIVTMLRTQPESNRRYGLDDSDQRMLATVIENLFGDRE